MTVHTLNITLDDKEYANAMKKKGGRTWKKIFLAGLEKEGKQE
jgi:hypothetical protein